MKTTSDSVFWRYGPSGAFLKVVKGRNLDSIALTLGITRERRWWVFRESDTSLRLRCLIEIGRVQWQQQVRTEKK